MIFAGVTRNNRLYAHDENGKPCRVPDEVRNMRWQRADGEVRILRHLLGPDDDRWYREPTP